MSDLIERSAVLDLMRTNWADNDGDTAMQLSIDDVRNLPAAPKQRTGKWIKVVTETDSFGNETYHHECSVCKCNKSGWGQYRFCPNCGAKMEGESEC